MHLRWNVEKDPAMGRRRTFRQKLVTDQGPALWFPYSCKSHQSHQKIKKKEKKSPLGHFQVTRASVRHKSMHTHVHHTLMPLPPFEGCQSKNGHLVGGQKRGLLWLEQSKPEGVQFAVLVIVRTQSLRKLANVTKSGALKCVILLALQSKCCHVLLL